MQAHAQVSEDSVDNFDWNSVIPDQYTITLAKMYVNIESNLERRPVSTSLLFSNNFNKVAQESISTWFVEGTTFLGLGTTTAYINDDVAKPFSREFMRNNGISAQGFNEWMDRRQGCAAGAYPRPVNTSAHQTYLYWNTSQSAEWNCSPSDIEETIHHELAHAHWYDINSNTQGTTDARDAINCWIYEGFANVFGATSLAMTTGKEEMRSRWITSVSQSLPGILTEEKSVLIDVFMRNQRSRDWCVGKSGGYSVGMLLIEYLYMSYDATEVTQLWKNMKKEIDLELARSGSNFSQIFDSSLKKTLGLSEADFYSLAFDHVIASYKRETKAQR